MSDELTVRRERGNQFLQALLIKFQDEAVRTGPFVSPVIWIAGGLSTSGDPVVIYRQSESEPLVGRIWDLDRLARLFTPSTPETLAHDMWHSEVNEPDFDPRRLDVDWADGLVDDPEGVLWLGCANAPD
ncbi:MAG: hypothetical protein LH624_00820 [Cryobacterium sp.]|nr:hypothetical protein [Cryobacterium sp.]